MVKICAERTDGSSGTSSPLVHTKPSLGGHAHNHTVSHTVPEADLPGVSGNGIDGWSPVEQWWMP